MQIDELGYARPSFDHSAGLDGEPVLDEEMFGAVCPGRRVAGRPGRAHPTFGVVLEAWSAWATDPDIRHVGSSGGVLTALSQWLVRTGRVDAISTVGAGSPNPLLTAARTHADVDAVRGSAGSRYAPSATLENADVLSANGAVVCKPCEASALRALAEARGSRRPIVLSFFCAGVPSQASTERLVREAGMRADEVTELRYRGHGWPGKFTVRTTSGTRYERSYEESWGHVLGPTLQDRCKVCIDGTGESADLSAGDYWAATATGYPAFDEAPGRSALLVRTERGRDLLREAVAAGVLTTEPIDLDMLERSQPLQHDRRRVVAGRALGRTLAGKRAPAYGWKRLLVAFLRHPLANARAAAGAFKRVRRKQPA